MQLECDSNKHSCNSRSLPMLIKPTSTKQTIFKEYGLVCNNFDPNKSSPPDEWSQRLLQRLGTHNNSFKYSSTYGNKK